jgi:hypothetical protein
MNQIQYKYEVKLNPEVLMSDLELDVELEGVLGFAH